MNNDRYYDIEGEKYVSVTTVLNILNKPYLIPWVKKEAREATIEAVWEWLPNSNTMPIDEEGYVAKEELRSIITESVKAHEKIAQKALDIGSFTHNCIEVYEKEWKGTEQEFINFISEYYPKAQNEPEMLQVYFNIKRRYKIRVIASEQVVWHPHDKYAGTLDLLAEVNGALSIIDIKTSKQLSWEYWLQVEAYRRSFNRSIAYNLAQKRYILRLDKEKPIKSEFIDCDEKEDRRERDWQAFLSCLNLYNEQKIWKK